MLEQFKRQHQKHYENDADELECYGFFKKSKARVTKYDDQSKQIICYLKEDQSEFLEECRRKNLASKCNVKRSGDLILTDCVDLSGYVPDDWRISAGYHEKGRQGSYVKRVATSESLSQYSGCKPNNVSNGLKHLRTHETMSVSRMKCGPPWKFPVDVVSKSFPEFKTARPNVQEPLVQVKGE